MPFLRPVAKQNIGFEHKRIMIDRTLLTYPGFINCFLFDDASNSINFPNCCFIESSDMTQHTQLCEEALLGLQVLRCKSVTVPLLPNST